MVWTQLTDGLVAAMRATGVWTEEHEARLEFAVPRDPAHGDWTTNIAMLLAKDLSRPPRGIAEALAEAFPVEGSPFQKPEVAGAGFVNFRYHDAFLATLPRAVVEQDAAFGRSDQGGGTRILVEYVSANPTGPLNVVSARAAAVGAALVRLLNATGHDAVGEFYVNDAGTQADLLGESLAARFAGLHGIDRPLPAEGYQGAYVQALAKELPEDEARLALDAPDGRSWFRDQALTRMLDSQQADLAEYGAEFAQWFRESTLHASRAVDDTLAALEARGMTYRATEPEVDNTSGRRRDRDAAPAVETGEATYVRSAQFGDDVDRVIMRNDGRPTYLLPDIAYHRSKRERGFRHAIDLWGPDHHGYVARMKASLEALGLEGDFLEVLIVQQVNLMSAGKPVKMSKRAGEFVTLRDLIDDVGADCAKFLFLMRSTSAHLDFDLDVARKRSDENPAYYVQYAHARICSILTFAEEQGARAGASGVYEAEEEQLLLRRLAAFPEVIRGAAAAREPHRLPAYLMDIASVFHRFYHNCRVVTDDADRTRARLGLCEAARIVLRNGLALLGVSAPERMERTTEPVT